KHPLLQLLLSSVSASLSVINSYSKHVLPTVQHLIVVCNLFLDLMKVKITLFWLYLSHKSNWCLNLEVKQEL
ncbi:MAG: hypothetical protein Q8881_02360, partial [Sweet potato little leaf phytoplasma]|nr:hypothetical protein [Sweet potato little leaf phytoplasma]